MTRPGAQATITSRLFSFCSPGLLSSLRAPTPTRLWLGLFTLWLLLISGFLGTPGIQQAVRLKSLLSVKQAQVRILQTEVKQLQLDAQDLEKNQVTQQREIRRVLGYAAPGEIIFDFSNGEQYQALR